eukprot:141587-Pleurochrysis_carterae.AAC.1
MEVGACLHTHSLPGRLHVWSSRTWVSAPRGFGDSLVQNAFDHSEKLKLRGLQRCLLSIRVFWDFDTYVWRYGDHAQAIVSTRTESAACVSFVRRSAKRAACIGRELAPHAHLPRLPLRRDDPHLELVSCAAFLWKLVS